MGEATKLPISPHAAPCGGDRLFRRSRSFRLAVFLFPALRDGPPTR